MPKHEKTHDKKMILIKTQFYTILISLILLSTYILVLCLEHILIRSLPNLYHSLKQQGKEKNPNIFERRNTNWYMKFRCEQHYNSTWIELNSNSTNWIKVQLNWIQIQL
jgi:hypothetical protein